MVLPPPTPEEKTPQKDLTSQIQLHEPYIQRGGFSTVYSGTWTDDSKVECRVAIKAICPTSSDNERDDPELIQRRLNRESRVWHPLRHENILEFLGIYQDPKKRISAMVSPLCSNGNLVDYLKGRTENDVVRPFLIRGISRALEYLHTRNIVHGDLKGHNVLIGDDGSPLLADFGRSKIIGSGGFTTVLFAGALRYMAPELLAPPEGASAEDEEKFDPDLTKESDVYGFGMLGLQILTGKQPFAHIKSDQMVLVMVTQQSRRPSRPSLLPPPHHYIWDILDQCWAKEPTSRPVMRTIAQAMNTASTH